MLCGLAWSSEQFSLALALEFEALPIDIDDRGTAQDALEHRRSEYARASEGRMEISENTGSRAKPREGSYVGTRSRGQIHEAWPLHHADFCF
jgi:hypothetical protein